MEAVCIESGPHLQYGLVQEGGTRVTKVQVNVGGRHSGGVS